MILTSNRTREVHDALKRRCLYHWLEHPDFDREVAILRRRLPEVTEQLAREVAARRREAAHPRPAQAAGHRRVDRLGRPRCTPWARATSTRTSPPRTLGAVLKYREDTDRVHALARGALFGG